MRVFFLTALPHPCMQDLRGLAEPPREQAGQMWNDVGAGDRQVGLMNALRVSADRLLAS